MKSLSESFCESWRTSKSSIHSRKRPSQSQRPSENLEISRPISWKDLKIARVLQAGWRDWQVICGVLSKSFDLPINIPHVPTGVILAEPGHWILSVGCNSFRNAVFAGFRIYSKPSDGDISDNSPCGIVFRFLQACIGTTIIWWGYHAVLCIAMASIKCDNDYATGCSRIRRLGRQ